MDANSQTLMSTGKAFCIDFVANPYLCYTEHGQHAYFFALLYAALPESSRYFDCNGKKVCAIQKEYPTATSLGRSKRQHWDIALIRHPAESDRSLEYDYLPLQAVAEFGMNERIDHLKDDIDRLTHDEANIVDKFVFHLYRLSEGANPISRRDWSPDSVHIKSLDSIANTICGTDVTLFFAQSDLTGRHANGAWIIRDSDVSQIA